MRFGEPATASVTRATIWFRSRSTVNGFSRERCANELRAASGDCPPSSVRDRRVGSVYGSGPSVIEFSAEVFNRAGGGGVQGGECARYSRGISGSAQAALGWEVWGDGYIARTVGDQMTAEVSKT